MRNNQKRIAVLLPVYNAEATLIATIESLNANKEPHDIILVDDGSAKPVSQILQPQDNLMILRLEKNSGITAAMNYGLSYILDHGYEFVARLDADDRAAPDRLSKQAAFLDKNPEIGMVGGRGRIVSESGEKLFYLNYPVSHDEILTKLFYNNAFMHPTLVIRSEILRKVGGYSNRYPAASQDYDLVRRIAKVTKVANLPDYLIDYTFSQTAISLKKRKKQLEARLRIQLDHHNYANVHFYLGILKTLSLWFIPVEWIVTAKKWLFRQNGQI